MPLSYPLLRENSVRLIGDEVEVRIWLPWMRSLPWTCILDVDLRLNGDAVPPESVQVDISGTTVTLPALREVPGYWMVGTPIQLRMPAPVGPNIDASIAVVVTCAIPYIETPDGPLTVRSRASVRTKLGTPIVD